jgi:bacillolysin
VARPVASSSFTSGGPAGLSAAASGALVGTPGVLPTNSPEAKAAINATLQYLNRQVDGGSALVGGGFDSAKAFTAKTVERDQLGMVHVRMDRSFEGIKVFGEQIIGHLGRDGAMDSVTGSVSAIPAGLGKSARLTAEDALKVAQKAFGRSTDRPPTVERVIFQDDQGTYHSGFRAELLNASDRGSAPTRMNYLIDGDSGKVVQQFDQMGGLERPRQPLLAAPTPAPALAVTGSASPNAPILDLKTTTSVITLPDDVAVDKLKLTLDIAHTFRGDLVVKLTSPAGTVATISNRAGGGADNLVGSFDLTAFAGEKTKGAWTLTVEDKAKRDTGALKSWSLNITPKDQQPPPPPPPADGAVDDTTLYSGKVNLSARKNADGTYSLEDSSRGKGVVTLNANNQQQPTGATEFTDTNNLWGESTDAPATKAAVDAHYGAQMTYDFYKAVLGRDSIDGQGEKLISNVHLQNNLVNAFWDGKQMNYGDGDGTQSGPLTTLDIAGHEISHGLTERTAGLIYKGESGGLNEAMSDIMGAGVEWYASQKNTAVNFDFTVGEDAWTPKNGDATDGLRYMNDPTKDNYSVDNYKNYPRQTEVHGSSGIANNAFFLMAQGGTNRTSGLQVKDGVGVEKSLKIFGRALTTYMTPTTTFAQARDACIKAASDLYGATSTEVKTVKAAWTAVGVESPAAAPA